MRTIAIVNQKGGCGKTTTAINLAGVFAAKGFRTLLVDMDPQGHCAAGLAIPEQRIDKTIGDAMLAPDSAPIDADRLLWRVSRNLDLAPSTTRLAALEASRGSLASRPDAEQRLKKALARFDSQYDVCLIDCSPAIGLLTFNSLVAADEVIVPVETGFFSLQGATKQINAIKALAKRLSITPTYRLLATMHDPKSMLSKDLLDEVRRRFAGRVIPVVIRYDVALREAASFGQPVIEYSRDSAGAEDYLALAQWLAETALSGGTPTGIVDEHDTLADDHADASAQTSLGHALNPPDHAQPSPTPDAAHSPALASHAAATVAPASSTSPAPGARTADMVARTRKLQQSRAASAADHAAVTPIGPAPTAAATLEPKPARSPIAYGVRPLPEGGGALFVLPATIGKRVSVAGEFNAWSSERTPLELSATGETWEARVPMPPGANQYRLVVDGAWIADPYNPNVAPNPFGGTNSVVMVPPASASNSGTHAKLDPFATTAHAAREHALAAAAGRNA